MSKLAVQYRPRSMFPEFSYGSFLRSVTLPAGADEDAIKAANASGPLLRVSTEHIHRSRYEQ